MHGFVAHSTIVVSRSGHCGQRRPARAIFPQQNSYSSLTLCTSRKASWNQSTAFYYRTAYEFIDDCSTSSGMLRKGNGARRFIHSNVVIAFVMANQTKTAPYLPRSSLHLPRLFHNKEFSPKISEGEIRLASSKRSCCCRPKWRCFPAALVTTRVHRCRGSRPRA